MREGYGTGEGRGGSPGEAHDVALKAAETDATKRALVTFGKAFGLALYANGHKKPEARSGDLTGVTDEQTTGSNGRAPTTSPDEHGSSASFQQDGKAIQATVTKAIEPLAAAQPVPEDLKAQPSLPAPVRLNGIDKSALTLGEPRRVRDKAHLRHVGAQPCLLCSGVPSDPHHLRFAQVRALGRKVSDEFTVPLCRKHHREVHHSGNEAAWWHDMGIDPIEIARELWEETRSSR